MANNSPFSSSGSVSSLLKGAAGRQRAVNDFNDSLMAADYAESAYTDTAYDAYKAYLAKRIKTLQSLGDLSSSQKALTLSNTLRSATRTNTSSSITRENIQIMAGSASLQDKYNLVSQQFTRAVRNGDLTLAQSLENQAYSISQQIQQQQDAAARANESLARAGEALAKKTAYAGARAEGNVGKLLKAKLKDFNDAYAHAGQATANKLTADFVKDMQPALRELGIHLSPGAQPNYFDIVEGVNRAAFKALTLAGDAVAPFADDGGQSWYDKAEALTSKIPTIYGDMNAQELVDAAANPSQFSYNQSPDFLGKQEGGIGGKRNPQIGYRYDPTKGVVPVIAQSPWIDVPKGIDDQMKALGLDVVGNKFAGGGYTVHPTDKTPDYIKKILPANSTTALTTRRLEGETSNNVLEFEADSVSGMGKAVYTIVKDGSGKQGIYESSALGDKLVGGDAGFNAYPTLDSSQHSQRGGFFGHLLSGIENSASSVFGLFGAHASAEELLNNAQYNQMVERNRIAAQKMLQYKPPPLPKIQVARPRPLPKITIAPPRAPATRAIVPKTINPQRPTSRPIQGGSGIPLQGGNIRLQ